MKQKQAVSPEHWAMDVFGDILTKGKMDITKNLWQLFIKINAANALVFLRTRTGTQFINGATLFWGYMMMTLCWMVEQTARIDTSLVTGKAPQGNSSMGLFILTIIAYSVIGLYRMYESNRNLRRTDGKGKPRYSGDSGLSVLWVPFTMAMGPFGLIATSQPRAWWQWNEFYFQKYLEPLLILLVGTLFKTMGYGAFGSFIILCGVSAFLFICHLEDNFFKVKQDTWDAEVLSGVVQHRDEPTQRNERPVIQQALIRSDRAGFEAWLQQRRKQSYFEKTTTVLEKQVA